MSVQDLESAVARLSPEELAAFAAWFEGYTLEGQTAPVDQLVEEAEREARLEKLRAEIQIGIDQLDRGEGVEWDPEAAWERIQARLAAEKTSS